VLADKPFFFGDKPASLDVSAFSILAQIHFISEEVKFPLRDYMQESCTNLVGHVNRIKEMCFPDWEDICKTGSQCSSAQTTRRREIEQGGQKEADNEIEMSEEEEKEVGENKQKEKETK